MSSKVLIAVVGPTAIGKTSLAIELANHFETEIISADSRQFYKEMNIGTAVPSRLELGEVKHHFIQHKSVRDLYSVGDFEEDALNVLARLFKKQDLVIMVGGSGLYIDAVIKGLDRFPEVDPQIRKQLNTLCNKEGISALQEELRRLDPVYYRTVDLHNPQRLIRALEVSISSNTPYSEFLNKQKAPRAFNTISVGLTAQRSIIYDRINKRVDKMMASGLLNEVKSLKAYRDNNALQTVGYKELFNFLDGSWELEFAVSEIKKNTRRFAKRQQTWFKKNQDILWVDYQEKVSEVISKIENTLENREHAQ